MSSSEAQVLNELYESLEHSPDDINILSRILNTWLSLSDRESARGVALRILSIDPNNTTAQQYLPAPALPPRPAPTNKIQAPALPSTPLSAQEWSRLEAELTRETKEMKLEATLLSSELKFVSNTKEHDKMHSTLSKIAAGDFPSAVSIASPPSAREVARTISTPENTSSATALLTADFESVIHWLRLQTPAPPPDTLRSRLIKRKTLLEAALPPSLHQNVTTAFATTERTHLSKRYANAETMLTGDPLASIPAAQFLVTEDNYAWDASELCSALAASGGAMRNPLTKSPFSAASIAAILSHPSCASLRPLREAQHRMRRGFRLSTIAAVEKLGNTMLADQSTDARQCREGIDEFLAHVATLPQGEQGAVEGLKIPARDRHTGQEYDYSVGEAVRDAKGNTTCFHKVGDFLVQAGGWLRGQGQG